MMTQKVVMTEIWDALEKNYGIDSKVKAVETITSGSLALDDVIGLNPGLPRGRLIQYAGKESCGKTLMSLVAIREWQRKDPKNWAVFVDAECSFNPSWATQIGVDVKRLKIDREENGRAIFNALCGIPHKEMGKPKAKLGLLDMIKENGGSDETGLGLIIIDSVAAMVSPIESMKEVGHTNISPLARFLPDALRRLKPLLSQTGVSCIIINQLRDDPGKMFGDPTTTPGGRALKHACDVMVNFNLTESKAKMFLDSEGAPYGHISTARIDKTKTGTPKKTCEFDLHYTVGVVNKHKEIGSLAIKYGVVERPNTKSYVYGGQNWVGKDNFFTAIEENENLQKEFMEKVQSARINFLAQESGESE
jgi:recombination protein RecA